MIHDLKVPSPVEHIYSEVAGRLKAMTDTSGNPVFQYVDLWNRQPDYLAIEKVFKMPAAFVEVAGIQYTDIDGDETQCIITLALHVCHKQLSNEDFTVYRLLQAAHAEVMEIESICIGRPERISTQTDTDHTSIVTVKDTYRIYSMTCLLEE